MTCILLILAAVACLGCSRYDKTARLELIYVDGRVDTVNVYSNEWTSPHVVEVRDGCLYFVTAEDMVCRHVILTQLKDWRSLGGPR